MAVAWPADAATCSGVPFCSARASSDPPASTSALTAFGRFVAAATCRGVRFSSAFASSDAPALTNARMTSALSFNAATCKAVHFCCAYNRSITASLPRLPHSHTLCLPCMLLKD
eukprot:scaffold7114_cov67-Phaeocystis_antarctica.AAC.3